MSEARPDARTFFCCAFFDSSSSSISSCAILSASSVCVSRLCASTIRPCRIDSASCSTIRCFSASRSSPGVLGAVHSSSVARASCIARTAASGWPASSGASTMFWLTQAIRFETPCFPLAKSGSLWSSTSQTGHTHTCRSSSCNGKWATSLRWPTLSPRHHSISSDVSSFAKAFRSSAVGSPGGGVAPSAERPSAITDDMYE